MNDLDISEFIDLYLDGWCHSKLAKKYNITIDQVNEWVESLHIVRPTKVSSPQEKIYAVCCKLFGKGAVVQEYLLDNKLRIDIAVPSQNVAIEFHGRQHFEYVEHFHKNHDNFMRSKVRDLQKKTVILRNGWCYIEFTYRDTLTDDVISSRIFENFMVYSQSDAMPLRKQDSQALQKEKQREYRKNRYRLMKEQRKVWRANGPKI